MGHSYSVAREEQEEEEFYRLIEAVEIAQQRSGQQDDLEGGLRRPRVAHGRTYESIPHEERDASEMRPGLLRAHRRVEKISQSPSPASDVARSHSIHCSETLEYREERSRPTSPPPSESARTHRWSTHSPERGHRPAVTGEHAESLRVCPSPRAVPVSVYECSQGWAHDANSASLIDHSEYRAASPVNISPSWRTRCESSSLQHEEELTRSPRSSFSGTSPSPSLQDCYPSLPGHRGVSCRAQIHTLPLPPYGSPVPMLAPFVSSRQPSVDMPSSTPARSASSVARSAESMSAPPFALVELPVSRIPSPSLEILAAPTSRPPSPESIETWRYPCRSPSPTSLHTHCDIAIAPDNPGSCPSSPLCTVRRSIRTSSSIGQRRARRDSPSPSSRSDHRDVEASEDHYSVRGMLSSRGSPVSPVHSLPEEQLERTVLRMHERVLAAYERSLLHWQSAFYRLERSRSPTRTRSPNRSGANVSRLRERSLEHRDRRMQRLEEQTNNIAQILQDVAKQLATLRDSAALSSTASLAPSHTDKTHRLPNVSGRGFVAIDDEKAAITAMMHSVQARPYPHRPYAVGLRAVRRCSEDWNPPWEVFPLKAFKGSSYTYIKIQAKWDDEDLLKELGRSYDKLRTVWRKWFSLRSVRSITMVYADHTCVYPKRLGPAGVSPSKNMRLRYFLHHPEQMKDRREFMQVLTARTDLGIEFVEGWQLTRISVAILLPVIASLLLGIFYSIFAGDVSDAFTIAGYMTSAYSVCLVLLGLLNFVEF